MSDKLKEALLAQIMKEREAAVGGAIKSGGGSSESTALFTHKAPPVQANQKSYKDIIGKAHPSGKSYYFTVYNKEDWAEEVQEYIPSIVDHFEFDHDFALAVLMGIEFNKVVFAYGPPGSGKTTTPEQICARINMPFSFVAGMGGSEPSDYIGSPWVENGSMTWKDGTASHMVRHGGYLLYDEPFKSSSTTNMWMQSLADDRRTLKLYGHPDPMKQTLKAAPTFRFCLADNVRGFGDDMDKYAAEIQDQSTLNRCAYKVHVDYMPARLEKSILSKQFPEATDRLISCVVSLANLIRNGWKKGDFTAPFSIRDTQEFVQAALFMEDAGEAFKQTYYGAVQDDSERQALKDAWNTAFGSMAKLN